jgi:23S rRNA pseudouridine1911/1915/1917 synthase
MSFMHPVTQEKIVIVAPVPNEDNLWREFANVVVIPKKKR